MRKYFYTNGHQKQGPFLYKELKNESLKRNTKVWYYGLENWVNITEIDELRLLSEQLPPELEIHKSKGSKKKSIVPKKKSLINIKALIIGFSCVILLLLSYKYIETTSEDRKLYDQIASSSYESDVDFQSYVDKFYRDAEVFGLNPTKPKRTIIKFAKLDEFKNTNHFHGISYGFEDDDTIEIYINPSTWKRFSKPMRYFLMYHELAHDVLNVDDLETDLKDANKLMYPELVTYENKTMDDFISSYHQLFQELSGNSINDVMN